MPSQGDLFNTPVEVTRQCGTCVTRNAIKEQQEHGDCSRHGLRHKDDAACEAWFGLEELRRPLYGGKRRG